MRETIGFFVFAVSAFLIQPCDAGPYEPRGVGGGGAMAAYSISPYSPLRFVATDMGTLFRSVDGGENWIPVSHAQITVNYDLALAGSVGFASDKTTVFYAPAGTQPKRSLDSGANWKPISVPLNKDEHIRYWSSDRPSLVFCATDQGLLRSSDQGDHWQRVDEITGQATGTLVLRESGKSLIIHATDQKVFLSRDGGTSFKVWFTPNGTKIRSFTGGMDAGGVTLAFIDTNGAEACAWAKGGENSWSLRNILKRKSQAEENNPTFQDCGFVWVHQSAEVSVPTFKRLRKEGGRFIRMAENDSKTLYVTGGNWTRGYGSKVWVSNDRGEHWNLMFHLYNLDKTPYRSWPADKLEYSAVGLDVGWDDNAYFSFAVNPLNSSEAGGTGHYFLHVTQDQGRHWKAPFTRFRDTGERTRGKRWSSTGLEVTSVMRLKFHPSDSMLGYAGLSDLGGYATEDGGATWRIARAQYNTHYDYAFDPADKDLVYAAVGSIHDFPLGNHAAVIGQGGIYRSSDRGRTWHRLTPETGPWNRQFISIAYDPLHKILYGGTQGGGVARSTNGGKNWSFLNQGLPAGDLIIPQIEIDPANGSAYLLVAGDAPHFTNQPATGIYILDEKSDQWRILRGNLQRPPKSDPSYKLWWYPSAFAVDFSRPRRDVLWLADMESKGAWLSSGVWRSMDRGQNWKRVTQFTHPTAIALDPARANTIYAAGTWNVDGSWGEGGALYSTDGGDTWKKNQNLPFLSNLSGIRPDPNNSHHLFYLFFGSGMLYGPKPQ